MGKPTFHLRIQRKIEHDASTIAGAKIAWRKTDAKKKQLEEAVKFCQENDCRGRVALGTGRLPPIKDWETINRRLDWKVKNGREHDYCAILSETEEQSIVSFIKNKDRCMQGMSKKVVKLILDVLRIRFYLQAI